MNDTQATANPLGYEKIGKLLTSYAVPSIIALIINSLYNMVDQIFIGQGVGFLGNGATNIIAPIATITIAIATLFGDGLAAFFSLSLGKGEGEKAAKGLGTSIMFGSVFGIIWTVLAFAFLKPLCLIFGATENILPYALDYGRIIVIGFTFQIVGNTINSAIRTDGGPRYAMLSMMIGAVLNIILDPIFIFVFHWGVEGAAIATIISQLFGLLFNIAYLFRMKTIKLSRQSFTLDIRTAGRIASLGFASGANNLTSTVVAFVSNNLMTKYGALSPYGADIPLTTFGLCMKVSMLAFSIVIGFTFQIVGNTINSAIRTDGGPRYAMLSMMIGAVLNIILDPIFIFVFHWGVEGAAIATIISQLFGLLFNIAYLFRMKTIKLSSNKHAAELVSNS